MSVFLKAGFPEVSQLFLNLIKCSFMDTYSFVPEINVFIHLKKSVVFLKDVGQSGRKAIVQEDLSSCLVSIYMYIVGVYTINSNDLACVSLYFL